MRDRTRAPLAALLLYGAALGARARFRERVSRSATASSPITFSTPRAWPAIGFLAAALTTLAVVADRRAGRARGPAPHRARAARRAVVAAQPSVRRQRDAVSHDDRAQSIGVDGASQPRRAETRTAPMAIWRRARSYVGRVHRASSRQCRGAEHSRIHPAAARRLRRRRGATTKRPSG